LYVPTSNKMVRLISIFILFLLFNFELPSPSIDENSRSIEYPQLSARAIGIGMAMTAVSGDEQCIFYNPAGLAGIRGFRIGQSHSLRHFPGEIRNLDQLDADPVSIVHPLPIGGVFANGFVLQGECGYDYMTRNEMDFPQRKEWGIERYDAYALNATPWTKIGFYHRSNIYRGQASPPSPSPRMWRGGLGGEVFEFSWQKEGEGGCFGFIQTILPGVNFGYSSEKMDNDYIPEQGVTTKKVRTGWSIKPLPWIHFVIDNETNKSKTRIEDNTTIDTTKRKNWGIELAIIPGVVCRYGSIDGNRTCGLSLGAGRFKLHYGEAKNIMPLIVGKDYPDRFKDIHVTSWSLQM